MSLKLKAWNGKKRAEKEPEDTLFLRLFEDPDGSVVVAVVDREGYERSDGNLISFNPDGTYGRWHFVSGHFGFVLNSVGQIKQDKS